MIVLIEITVEYVRELILPVPKKGGLCVVNDDVLNYFSGSVKEDFRSLTCNVVQQINVYIILYNLLILYNILSLNNLI